MSHNTVKAETLPVKVKYCKRIRHFAVETIKQKLLMTDLITTDKPKASNTMRPLCVIA